MPYLSHHNDSSLLIKILTKTVGAKEIITAVLTAMSVILLWMMYLSNPSPQQHADAIGSKLDGKIMPLEKILTPSPEYIDAIFISFTVMHGYPLTIGLFGEVYVYAKFTVINQESSIKSISPRMKDTVG